MCKVTYFQHKTCKHIWAIISEPCGPGLGFNTCNAFGDPSSVKVPPKIYRTQSRPCPRCLSGKGGLAFDYDLNAVRMVESMGWGFKWGAGPARADWGLELKFKEGCVVM